MSPVEQDQYQQTITSQSSYAPDLMLATPALAFARMEPSLIARKDEKASRVDKAIDSAPNVTRSTGADLSIVVPSDIRSCVYADPEYG